MTEGHGKHGLTQKIWLYVEFYGEPCGLAARGTVKNVSNECMKSNESNVQARSPFLPKWMPKCRGIANPRPETVSTATPNLPNHSLLFLNSLSEPAAVGRGTCVYSFCRKSFRP